MIDYYFNNFFKKLYMCVHVCMYSYIYIVDMINFLYILKLAIFKYFQINNYEIINILNYLK